MTERVFKFNHYCHPREGGDPIYLNPFYFGSAIYCYSNQSQNALRSRSMDFITNLSISEITAFIQIIMIDLSLAGDNAIVIGMAASCLPKEQRGKAIAFGIIGATVLRILFALFTVQLLKVPGLIFVGGLLLSWVSWKMYKQIRYSKHEVCPLKPGDKTVKGKKLRLQDAVKQIIIADVSMSLDNVLAVAGAAREHIWVLVFGLVFSVILMGAAATVVERLLRKYEWLAYAGLAIIMYVALDMVGSGGNRASYVYGKYGLIFYPPGQPALPMLFSVQL